MGWNSYDCYGNSVTEEEVKANADYMADNLAKHGWEYIVVDYYWYCPPDIARRKPGPDEYLIDEYGRLIPHPDKFPSAANGQGFKPLADYVHSKGLKFGIHIMRGIPREAVKKNLPIANSSYCAADIANEESICNWSEVMYGINMSKPGAQDYYDSIMELYAEWGVDFIKADDFASPYYPDEVAALSKARDKFGENIVLSLSPGGKADVKYAEHMKSHCEMWRVTEDFWDEWDQLKAHFEVCRKWAPHIGAGHWPDLDMLPIGRIAIRQNPKIGPERFSRFTKDEHYTLMTLWCIFRSPLMIGGDLPSMDDFTLSLITNEEVLRINQKSTNNREIFCRGNNIAWSADDTDSDDKYVALFNVGETPSRINVEFKEIGLNGKQCTVRDLWAKKNLGTFKDRITSSINPHGACLYRISPKT